MNQFVVAEARKRLLPLIASAVEHFGEGDWLTLGAQTGCLNLVRGHDRLLRSKSFGDDDYAGNAHEVMFNILSEDPANLKIIEDFIELRFGPVGENVSIAKSKSRQIVFSPSVFEVPEGGVENDLVAVMMPFSTVLEPVFTSIQAACKGLGLRCMRAKDLWVHETVIQDVFSLLFRSHVVVCDFTGKNPNVFYEAGIAHTLGKTVIPITQSDDDIPFDLRHHRYLKYLNNYEGRLALRHGLDARLITLLPF